MDIIFDLDGTLANLDHRLSYVKHKPKNWKAFFAGVADDKPIDIIVRLFKQLDSTGKNRLIICSGRSASCRVETEFWLAEHDINYTALYMRDEGDFRADDIIKKELLDEIRADGFEPVLVFDDRQRVVDMWRENGLTCCQVAKGDF